MDLPLRSITIARMAAALFGFWGVLALIGSQVYAAPLARPVCEALGYADLAIMALLVALPWDRWSRRASLLVVVPAALASAHGFVAAGCMPPYGYPLFLFLLFLWIGVSQPPLTGLALAPVAVLAHLGVLRLELGLVGAVRSVGMATLIAVLAAELLSRVLFALQKAQARLRSQTELLAGLLSASNAMSKLDSEHVVEAAVESVLKFGVDAASIALLDAAGNAKGCSRGLADDWSGDGVLRLITRERRFVVVQDQTTDALAAQLAIPAGQRSAVLVPIWRQSELQGALCAFRKQTFEPTRDETMAFELLADQVGRSLDNARRFERQRKRAHRAEQAAMIDPLTAVGNRRRGEQLLTEIARGDALVMLDLDHFKRVNDTQGHPAGDALLRELARVLSSEVREHDEVVRYGGEEFMLVLRQVGEAGLTSAQRLLDAWRATRPVTTFSAGVAVHRSERTARETLVAADAALYDAKHRGRDRVCVESTEADPALARTWSLNRLAAAPAAQ